MTPCLDKPWRLCIEDNRAYVERCSDQVRVAALSPLEAVAIRLMDGERTDEAIESLMYKIADYRGMEVLSQLKKRLKPLLTTGICNPPSASLNHLARLKSPLIHTGIRPLPGPRVLHWLVTESCPRQCIYCYANPKRPDEHNETVLPRERLNEIFAEASSLGATALLVAGGEPFLRFDLPEVLGDAIRNGLHPGVTTKYPVSWELAQRIANAGMTHICLSVDSFNEQDNAALVGSANYGEQVRTSVKHLEKASVAYSFELVLTRLNRHALESVIAEGERLCALSVLVVPYEPVTKTIGDYRNEDLALPVGYDLNTRLHRLRKKYTQIKVERFEYLGEESRQQSNCDIGLTKLFVNATGRVHRCYKLLDDPTLSGADLNTASVAEAWHDPSFNAMIHPPLIAYGESDCSGCTRFSQCHSEGRCIYKAFVDHQTYYSKDRNCDGPWNGKRT